MVWTISFEFNEARKAKRLMTFVHYEIQIVKCLGYILGNLKEHY